MRALRILMVCAVIGALAVGCSGQGGSTVAAAKAASPTPAQPAAKPAPAAQPAAKPPPAAQPAVKPAPAEKAPAPVAKKETAPAANPNLLVGWDFVTLPKEKWAGVYFPGGVREKFPRGAAFTLWDSGMGPEIVGLNTDASQLSAIRIEITANRTKDGEKKTPVKLSGLKAKWASSDTGKNPFAKCKGVAFEVKDPSKPDVWTATLKGAEGYKGKIVRLGISVELPEALKANGKDRYHLIVKSIEVLK